MHLVTHLGYVSTAVWKPGIGIYLTSPYTSNTRHVRVGHVAVNSTCHETFSFRKLAIPTSSRLHWCKSVSTIVFPPVLKTCSGELNVKRAAGTNFSIGVFVISSLIPGFVFLQFLHFIIE
jgi:hypothetical protein